MEISSRVDLVQRQVRAASKDALRQEKTGMGDLFGAESLVDRATGHAKPHDVDEFWRAFLADGPKRIGRGEFADILECLRICSVTDAA